MNKFRIPPNKPRITGNLDVGLRNKNYPHEETQGALNGVSNVKIGHKGAEEHLRK